MVVTVKGIEDHCYHGSSIDLRERFCFCFCYCSQSYETNELRVGEGGKHVSRLFQNF